MELNRKKQKGGPSHPWDSNKKGVKAADTHKNQKSEGRPLTPMGFNPKSGRDATDTDGIHEK